MSRTARFTIDPAFTVGEVNPRLFGSFVEHLGRCVYTGVFEPGHPAADEAGTDVVVKVRDGSAQQRWLADAVTASPGSLSIGAPRGRAARVDADPT